MSSPKDYKIDITIAKGLGIVLVVVGHVLAGGHSQGNEWYDELTRLIYLFHMPFFMAISGYLYFRPGRVDKLWPNYSSYFWDRAVNLLLPFLLMGGIVLVGKMAAASFLHVDNKPADFIQGIMGLFWHTANSPSQFIWYIFVLFVYSITVPVLFRFIPKPLYVLSALSIVLYLVPPVPILYLDKITTFFIFFMIGGLLRAYEETYLKYVDELVLLFLFLFIGSFLIDAYQLLEPRYVKLAIGILSIPALHGLCRIMMTTANPVTRAFANIGVMTLIIYLFNTICIGVTKAILFKFMTWDGANFFLFFPTLIVAGVVGPLIIGRVWDLRHLALARIRVRA